MKDKSHDNSDLPNSHAGSVRPSWLAHCRLSTAKLPYFNLLSSFNCKTSLFWFIVQFQLQNFFILIYCPVPVAKLLYFDLLSSFSCKTSLFLFIAKAKFFRFILKYFAGFFRFLSSSCLKLPQRAKRTGRRGPGSKVLLGSPNRQWAGLLAWL